MRGRNGSWHRYYYCRNHDPLRAGGTDRRCPERNIRADALDDFVFDRIRTALLHPDPLLAGEQAVAAPAPIPTTSCSPLNSPASTARSTAADDESGGSPTSTKPACSRSPRCSAAPPMSPPASELQAKRTSLAEQRTALARGNQVHRRVHDFAERIRDVIGQLDADQKQQLLRLLIEEVRVTGWHVEIRLRIALDQPPPNPPGPKRSPEPHQPPSQARPLSSKDRLRSVGSYQRNAKLQLTVLLSPAVAVPGLYLHPDHRRRLAPSRFGVILMSSNEGRTSNCAAARCCELSII